MDLLLRAVSAGGWLAHLSNHWFSFDRDSAVRPRWIFLGVGMAWAVPAGLVVASLAAVGRGQSDANIGLALVLASPFFVIGLLMLLGWRARLVPYVETGGVGADVEPQATSIEGEPTRVTGFVVDEKGIERVYRHRPAELTLARNSLSIAVAHVAAGLIAVHKPVQVARVRLRPADVSELGRGRAILFSGSRPAVKLETGRGPLVLAFAEATERDRVFAALDGWKHGRVAQSQPSAEERKRVFAPGRGIIDNPWLKGIAFGIMVASLWKIVAYAGPGDPVATVVAGPVALLSVLAWELAWRLRHLPRPVTPSYLAVAVGGAIAVFTVVIPLGFHIGRGVHASILLAVLGGGFLIVGPRNDA